MPFQTWEEQIEKHLVVLPEQFEEEMKNVKRLLPQPVANDAPDIILVEPEVETIDLGVDSDSENELKEQVEREEAAKMAELETANAVASIGAQPQFTELSIEEDLEALKNTKIPLEPTASIGKLPITKIKQEINNPEDVTDFENISEADIITEPETTVDSENSQFLHTEGCDQENISEPKNEIEPNYEDPILMGDIITEPETTVDSENSQFLHTEGCDQENISEPKNEIEPNYEDPILMGDRKDNIDPNLVVDCEGKENKKNEFIAKQPSEETQKVNIVDDSMEIIEEHTEKLQPVKDIEIIKDSSDEMQPVKHVERSIETIKDPTEEMQPVNDVDRSIEVIEEPTEDVQPVKDIGRSIKTIEDSQSEEVQPVSDIENSLETVVESPEDSMLMPQITNVFGNVHVEDVTLARLSNIIQNHNIGTHESQGEIIMKRMHTKTSVVESLQPEIYSCDDDDEIEDDIIKTEIIDNCSILQPNVIDSNGTTDVEKMNSISGEVKKECVDKSGASVDVKKETDPNLFGEVIPDVTFDDDGIEFVDDGIAVDDPDVHAEHMETNCAPLAPVTIEPQDVETAKFDLKLLMEPVVYTTKLDDMLILKRKTYSCVKDKENIDIIIAESKPVSKRSINNIVKEKEDLQPLLEDDKKIDDDLFENSSNASDYEYIPENKKVKLTSSLLQKPRNLNYNPIMLCKNPDFNTRLKRLTAGFLSSTRNRLLLKACKPLTIDVCKAFECKVYNSTVYLKSGPAVETADENTLPDTKIIENQQTKSVIPSAIPVQSLIDNMKTNIDELFTPQIGHVCDSSQKLTEDPVLREDNQNINSSHIYNSWSTNQRLLIAEVSPLKPHAIDKCQPPVHLVSPNKDYSQNPASGTESKFVPINKETENSSRKIICSGTVVGGTNQTFTKPDLLPKLTKYNPRALSNKFTVKRKITRGFWNNKHDDHKPLFQTLNNYVSDHLLTIDTVNRIINVVAEPDSPYRQNNFQKLFKAAKKKVITKSRTELQQKLDAFERRIRGKDIDTITDNISTDDKILIIDKDRPKLKPKLPKYPKPKIRVKTASTDIPNITDKMTANEDFDEKNITEKIQADENIKTIKNSIKSKCKKLHNPKAEIKVGGYCCAARFHLETGVKHQCTENCICCCKNLLPEFVENELSIIKACETIESVVQNTRKLLEVNKNISLDNAAVVEKSVDVDIDTSDTIEIADSPTNDTSHETPILCQSPPVSNSLNSNTNSANPTKFIVIKKAGVTSTSDKAVNVAASVALNIPGDSLSADKPLILSTDAANPIPKLAVIAQSSDGYMLEKPVIVLPRRKRGRPPKIAAPSPSQQVNTFNVPSQSSAISKQTHYVVSDLVSSNQYFPVVKDSVAPEKEKVLFISSKSMSKEQNDNPLFLGKNKILLTNIKLPRNQEKASESLKPRPCSITSPMPLPKGVNMVLSPSGELTCLIDPTTNLDAEQLVSLSSVVSTLKQQITAASLTALQSTVNLPHNVGETVEVPDDENIFGKGESHSLAADKVLSENSDIFTPVAQSDSSDTTVQTGDINLREDTKMRETSNLENEDIHEVQLDKINQVTNNKNETVNSSENIGIQRTDESAGEISTQANNDTEPSIVSTAEHSNSLPVSHNLDTSTDVSKAGNNLGSSVVKSDNSKNEVNVSETANLKKKTILSDLMEMSGIFEEDTAPLMAEPTPPVAPPAVNIDIKLTNELVLPNLVASNEQPVDLPELNTVTSFSELKYASDNNGLFFKLDLDTGNLAPINVFIRKNKQRRCDVPIAPKPNQVIDLTDDQDMVVVNKMKFKQTNQNQSIKIRTTFARKTSSLLKRNEIKPLKLFKVVQISKKFEKSNLDSEQLSNIKGPRKQPLSTRVDTIDLNDHEGQVFEVSEGSNVESDNYTVTEQLDSNDSSDDEPLAVKARRKNKCKNKPEDTVSLMEVDSENVSGEDAGNVQATPELLPGEGSPKNQETGMICMPSELNFDSDHEADEDCILGV